MRQLTKSLGNPVIFFDQFDTFHLLGSKRFSFNLEKGVYSGYTVSCLAMQVAIYLGFMKIIHLGLDLKYNQGPTHFFGRDSVSANHENTEIPKMIRMMGHAAEVLADTDIEIYNCGPDSALTCFEQVSLDWAIQQS